MEQIVKLYCKKLWLILILIEIRNKIIWQTFGGNTCFLSPPMSMSMSARVDDLDAEVGVRDGDQKLFVVLVHYDAVQRSVFGMKVLVILAAKRTEARFEPADDLLGLRVKDYAVIQARALPVATEDQDPIGSNRSHKMATAWDAIICLHACPLWSLCPSKPVALFLEWQPLPICFVPMITPASIYEHNRLGSAARVLISSCLKVGLRRIQDPFSGLYIKQKS